MPPPAPAPTPLRRVVFGLGAAFVFLTLLGLGTWQVQRRAWKLDLIARTEGGSTRPPCRRPPPPRGPRSAPTTPTGTSPSPAGSSHDRETRVQAVTEYGAGFWVLTPLRREDGSLVLVNRGFVPWDRKDPASRPEGQVAGPGDGHGPPAPHRTRRRLPARERSGGESLVLAGRGRHRRRPGLSDVAPYFVDADAAPNPGGLPVGGLTVVSFPNSHLVYAVTWYGLALMLGGFFVYRRVTRRESPSFGSSPRRRRAIMA